MPAIYHFFNNPEKEQDPDKPKKLHPRIVKSHKVTVEELGEKVTSRCTFTAGETTGLMGVLKKIILDELMEGNTIHWKGFGTFSLTLECDPVDTPEEMTPSRVRVKNIRFQMEKVARQQLASTKFVRSKDHPKTTLMTPQERQENILHYLKTHDKIHSGACCSINGCGRTTGYRDLKALSEKGLIREIATVGMTMYVLNEKTEE